MPPALRIEGSDRRSRRGAGEAKSASLSEHVLSQTSGCCRPVGLASEGESELRHWRRSLSLKLRVARRHPSGMRSSGHRTWIIEWLPADEELRTGEMLFD